MRGASSVSARAMVASKTELALRNSTSRSCPVGLIPALDTLMPSIIPRAWAIASMTVARSCVTDSDQPDPASSPPALARKPRR